MRDSSDAAIAALANRGLPLKRLRVGDFRILFEETDTEIVVADIGPRGSIYK